LSKRFDLGARMYTDWDEFAASGLDAVVVCTPNHLHVPQTVTALKAGFHVLCEKPMAASTADATKAVDASRKAGKILQINQTFRYWPMCQVMAQAIADGAIGRPIHVRSFRCLAATPDKGWSPGARWFVSKAAQGGLVLDLGVHMTDLMQWLVGPVTDVAAKVDTLTEGIDVPDNVTALMRFENGASGVLTMSWTMPCGGNVFEIFGTEGTLRTRFEGERPIEISRPGARGEKVTYPKVPKKAKNSQQAFIDAILGIAPSPTPGELGRSAVALCEAIVQSGESGKFVKVKRFDTR
jgi:1,5-anhydro-D-fructose reductase (1,5-anhydro-D-mannitol-forming)